MRVGLRTPRNRADRHSSDYGEGRRWQAARSRRSTKWKKHVRKTLLGALTTIGVTLGGCHGFTHKNDTIKIDDPVSSHDGQAAYRMAMHAYHKGHVNHAITKLEKAIRINPRHAAAHNNLGLIYYQQRKLSLAAMHFDTARDILDEDPRPLNNLGMTLESGGRVLEAIEHYEQASELDPENPLYLGNLLRARIRLGENNDVLIDRLRYLAFIETRPDWVGWIDEQLAIHLNPTLDRGPVLDQNDALRNRDDDEPGYRGSISDDHSELEVLEPETLELPPARSESPESLPVPTPLSWDSLPPDDDL